MSILTALMTTALASGAPGAAAGDTLAKDPAGRDALHAAAQSDATQGGETLVRPIDDGPEAYFDDFTPGQDVLVVTYADGTPTPEFADLRLSYDAEYEETEVTLITSAGPQLVCFLPGVKPADLPADRVEFLPQSAAQRLLAA